MIAKNGTIVRSVWEQLLEIGGKYGFSALLLLLLIGLASFGISKVWTDAMLPISQATVRLIDTLNVTRRDDSAALTSLAAEFRMLSHSVEEQSKIIAQNSLYLREIAEAHRTNTQILRSVLDLPRPELEPLPPLSVPDD